MALAFTLPARSVMPDEAILGIRVPSPEEFADTVNCVVETAATLQATADAVPVLLMSAPVKLVASIASLNVTVKLTGTEFVTAA